MRSLSDIWQMWEKCALQPGASTQLSDTIAMVIANQPRYASVAKSTGIPAWVIAAIHYREASFDFSTWLANGDPLYIGKYPVVTTHVPAGLGPATTWEEAAMISFQHEGWGPGMAWDLASALMHCEDYNGLGYAKRGIPSPYIWASTNQYKSGLYVGDGQFDPNKVDERLGCAAIAIGLKIHGFNLNEVPPA